MSNSLPVTLNEMQATSDKPKCAYCSDLDFPERTDFISVSKLSPYASRCRFCAMICDVVTEVKARMFMGAGSLLYGSSIIDDLIVRWKKQIHTFKGLPVQLIIRFSTYTITIELFTVPDEEREPIHQLLPFRNNIAPDAGSESCLTSARKWHDQCLRSHAACETTSNFFPKRVLRIQSKTSQEYRLQILENSSLIAPYVALSHCWGREETIRTLKTNVDSFKQSVPWASLPQTFKDAVIVTDYLGYSFLWIDSLCIVQNMSVDWEEQSAEMANIYECATFTISAASAAGDTEGFLGPRRYCGTVQLTPDPGCPPRSIIFERYFYHRVDGYSDNYNREWKFEPLYTRAWAFQERALAPRVLRFGMHELFWECRTHGLCECGERDGGDIAGLQVSWSQHLSGEIERSIYDFWYNNVIMWYTRGQLTKSSDKLPALSGLATRVQQNIGDEYIAGLWKADLVRGLLWIGPAYMTAPQFIPKEYRAPSFSWASVDGEIYYMYRLDPLETHLEIIHVSCKLATVDTFGQVSDGQLVLRGVLRPVWIFVSHKTRRGKTRVNFPEQKPTEDDPPGSHDVSIDAFLDATPAIDASKPQVHGGAEPLLIAHRNTRSTPTNVSDWCRGWCLPVCTNQSDRVHSLILGKSLRRSDAFERLGFTSVDKSDLFSGLEMKEIVIV